MPPNLFNGHCAQCQQFRPRCAEVHLRMPGKPATYYPAATVLCEVCRATRHGYRLSARHQKGKL